jgi:hypothetical protein
MEFRGSTLADYEEFLSNEVLSNDDEVRDLYQRLTEGDRNFEILFTKGMLTNEQFVNLVALLRIRAYDSAIERNAKFFENKIDMQFADDRLQFVKEILKNADDCRHQEALVNEGKFDGTQEVDVLIDDENSSIEFVYDEAGFTRRDVWAISSFFVSNKLYENKRGTGFKSVFAADAERVVVSVYSKDFSFRFNSEIGTIVPIWVNARYASDRTHVVLGYSKPFFSMNSVYEKFESLLASWDFLDYVDTVKVEDVNSGYRMVFTNPKKNEAMKCF